MKNKQHTFIPYTSNARLLTKNIENVGEKLVYLYFSVTNVHTRQLVLASCAKALDYSVHTRELVFANSAKALDYSVHTRQLVFVSSAKALAYSVHTRQLVFASSAKALDYSAFAYY